MSTPVSASTSTIDKPLIETLEGIRLNDHAYFETDCDWSLISFLLYRQQCSDFRSNRVEEHDRYAYSLTKMINWEEAPVNLMKRASRAFTSFQKEKKSKLIVEFWKGATSAGKRKSMAIAERTALMEEHATTVVNLTSQQDRILREKFTKHIENSDTEDYRSNKRKREDKGARSIVASNTSSLNTVDDDFIDELKEHKIGNLAPTSSVEFKRAGKNEELSTPSKKIRTIFGTEMEQVDNNLISSDEEFLSTPLTNIFDTSQESTKSEIDIVKTVGSSLPRKKSPRKYINYDIASEVLKAYRTHVLPGERLVHGDVDIMSSAVSKMKKVDSAKSPLSIGVLNIHNSDCTKFLSLDFKNFIADQAQDDASNAICFANGRCIDKFSVDCEIEVLQFLDKFHHINDLESLGKCLDENPIDHSTASNDLIYTQNLFLHFFFLYKNDTLSQPLSESEFSSYIWTPLIRNAFLGKDDLRLSCGELASKSYEKLKEILNVSNRSSPKLDGKGFLKSLGTEILAQEDGVLNTHSKRTGDLQKLEYCSKVILTALFCALPSATKASIIDIESYTLQSNGFRLKISTSKYLFEDIIITMDLQHVEVPKTVEGFSKLVVGVKTILSWKARTRKNTVRFYEALERGHERLTNGVFFSPVKISV